MADDTLLNLGSGGNTLRTLEDAGGIHWPVGVVAYATTVGTPDVLTIPVAAALGDDTANPTTLLSGSCLLVFDGSTWDRARGDSTDGLLVNLGTNNDVTITSGTVTNVSQLGGQAVSMGTGVRDAGTQRVTIATDDVVPASQSGTWNITNVSGTVSLPTGAATSANQSTAITALQLIDDVIFVDDADWTALTSKHALIGGVYQSSPGSITDGDTGPLRLTVNGAAHVAIQGNLPDTAAGDLAAINTAVSGTLTVGTHAVTQSGTWNITNISGTVSLPTGAATEATLGSVKTAVELIDDAVYTDATGTPSKGVAVMGTDGTNPQIIAVDTSGNVQVDLVTANVTNAGTFAVQVNGDALTALQLIDNCIYVDDADWTATTSSHSLIGGVYQSSPGSITDGDTGPLRLTVNGAAHVAVQNTVTVASHNVTNAGTFAVQVDGTALTRLTDIETNTDFGATTGGGVESGALRVTLANDSTGLVSVDDNGGSLTVDLSPQTSGGLSISRQVDLDETHDTVKGSTGQLYGMLVMNLSAAVVYLQIYDATSPTVGTTTPTITIPIPTQGDTNGAGFVWQVPHGMAFATAITVACTTTLGGSAGPAANAVIGTFLYK